MAGMLKILKIGKWVSLSSAVILASLFVLHLIITPTDDGKAMLFGAIGSFGYYLLMVRGIRRISN